MPRPKYLSVLVAYLGLVVVWLIGLWPMLAGGAQPKHDADGFFAPYFMLIGDHARAGQLVRWDPWTECGTPIFADPQVGAFSPVVVACSAAAGPSLRGFTLYWFAVWLFGGVGTMALARRLGAPAWGAWVSAVGFGFSGFAFGHAQHLSFVTCFALLPWTIWRLDVALLERRILPAIEAGAFWGLSALSGYPGMVVVCSGIAFAWTLGRTLTTDDDQKRTSWRSAIASLLLLAGVGIAVMAPAYVAFAVEGRGYSSRRDALSRDEAATSNALPPRGLLTFASPYLPTLQLPAAGQPEWTTSDVSALGLYVVCPSTWLAVAGLALARGGWRWWLLLLATLGLGLALGSTLPLRGWLYDLLPPARFFRHAGIFRACPIFASAVLAAIGSREIERLRQADKPAWPLALPVVGVALAAAAISCFYYARSTVDKLPAGAELAAEHVCLLWPAVALLSLAGLVGASRAAFLRSVPAILVVLTLVDLWLTCRLSAPIAFLSDQQKSWEAVQNAHVASLELALRREVQREVGPGNTNKHLYSRTAVWLGYPNPMSSAYVPPWRLSKELLRPIVYDRRALFAPRAALVEPNLETFAAFQKTTETKGMPMVVHPAAEPPAGPIVAVDEAPTHEPIAIDLVEYVPNRIAFDATCPSDGWLVLTDRWAAGWTATVDGRPVPVAPAMFLFRGVPVHAGINRIEFDYRPWGHPYLVAVSWAVLALVMLAAIGRSGWRRVGFPKRSAGHESPAATSMFDD